MSDTPTVTRMREPQESEFSFNHLGAPVQQSSPGEMESNARLGRSDASMPTIGNSESEHSPHASAAGAAPPPPPPPPGPPPPPRIRQAGWSPDKGSPSIHEKKEERKSPSIKQEHPRPPPPPPPGAGAIAQPIPIRRSQERDSVPREVPKKAVVPASPFSPSVVGPFGLVLPSPRTGETSYGYAPSEDRPYRISPQGSGSRAVSNDREHSPVKHPLSGRQSVAPGRFSPPAVDGPPKKALVGRK